MEIKAKGKFDLELCKALVRFSMFKTADPKKRMRFWAFAYAILLLIVLWEIATFGAGTFLLVLLGVEVAAPLILCYFYFIVPKIKYKGLGKMKDAENEYVFAEDELRVFTRTEEYSGEAAVKYSAFVKVYETSRYFFLFQPQNQVFAVDKSTLENGTKKDVREKLISALAGKYVICKY